MSGPAPADPPAAVAAITAATVLGVSTSLKPAPGRSGRSAARGYLTCALDALHGVYPEVALLDLRDHPLPWFDGRRPEDCGDPALDFVGSCIGRAGALLLAVPSYWNGVSGVFKNFVDVLCGPAYDLPDPAATVFAGKPVGLIVVGADEASTRAGCGQAREILRSTGARLIGEPVAVANPRAGVEAAALTRQLVLLAAEVARAACGQAAARP